MITAPTASYYIVKAEGEAAQAVAHGISPSVSADIESCIIVSADYDIDIMAVHNLSSSIKFITDNLDADASVDEKYNPLYISDEMSQIDEMLNLDGRSESIRFIGMNGNPYTLKIVDVKLQGESLVTGKVDYRPFDFPAYSEIVSQTEQSYEN